MNEPRFDWREEVLEKVRAEFTTQILFDKYLMPAWEKAMAGK
jgi:hypothetical protein